MRADTFTFEADDGAGLFVYRWLPDEGIHRTGVVHVVHGMAEHSARYARLAETLDFFVFLQQEMPALVERWEQTRSHRGV